ncbi:glycerol kinase [Gracilaria domingensis]|nr:glycerol kinase [Gracilaria domingensis]
MIENVPAVATAINEGRALFGTVDTWLVWNLSEEKSHVTDVTNAGRTMMMNIRSLEWDDYLLRVVGISSDILPKILPCSATFGKMGGQTALTGTVISGVIGDQQSALVGQACFNVGEAKSTFGTGCFLIVNTGTEPKFTKSYLLTTPGYQFGSKPCVYSLEGSIAVAGAAITWLRDNLGIINSASEVEALARSVEDTDDVYVVPAFSGFLAPYWREDARGTIVGITQKTTKAHIARATLESIAYKTQAVLEASEKDMGIPLQQLRVDGGAAVNNLLMEMQADIVGREVLRPKDVETTAMGAAFAAGHAIGLYGSLDEFRSTRVIDESFMPQISEEERNEKISRWEQAVERSLGWVLKPEQKPWISVPSSDFVAAAATGVAIGALIVTLACRYKKM